MTYGLFLLIFLVAPITVLLMVLWRQLRRHHWLAMALVSIIAFVYTTPWDNYAAYKGLWTFAPEFVWGPPFWFGWLPLEEYLFYFAEAIFTCLAMVALAQTPLWKPEKEAAGKPEAKTPQPALPPLPLAGVLAPLPFGKLSYLLILWLWALPVLAVQWVVARRSLWRARWLLLATLLLCGTYLSLADHFAIAKGIWQIQEEGIVGWRLQGHLPLEEAMFFYLTVAMSAQGFWMIAEHFREKWEAKEGRVLSNAQHTPEAKGEAH